MDKPKYVHSSRIAKATDQEIITAYQTFRNLAAIVRMFNVCEVTVRRVLKQANVSIRRGRPRT